MKLIAVADITNFYMYIILYFYVCFEIYLKCVYFRFMNAYGWDLMWTWLRDAIETDNTMLIQDILRLLLFVPVTNEHLQSQKGPKLLKLLIDIHYSQGIAENFM